MANKRNNKLLFERKEKEGVSSYINFAHACPSRWTRWNVKKYLSEKRVRSIIDKKGSRIVILIHVDSERDTPKIF